MFLAYGIARLQLSPDALYSVYSNLLTVSENKSIRKQLCRTC